MGEVTPGLVLGSAARRVLARSGQGRVFAVFERAFYLEGRGGLICLGPISLRAGPLNLLCVNWRRGEEAPGMLARLSGTESASPAAPSSRSPGQEIGGRSGLPSGAWPICDAVWLPSSGRRLGAHRAMAWAA
jgi:hypothetical protein